MLEKELIKKLFAKKKEETGFFDFQRMISPTKQLDPFLDRLVKGVRAKMQKNIKKQEEIFNRSPIESKETARQFILNKKITNDFILSKFQKACSLAEPLHPQQPEELMREGYKKRQQSIISQANQPSSSQLYPPLLRDSSSVLEQHREKYPKPYRIHKHKRAQYFSKHPELFIELANNLEILQEYLKYKDTKQQRLQHVLPFMLIQVKFNKNTLLDKQKWLGQIFSKEYVMLMERGDECLQSSTLQIHDYNLENSFKIKKYLSGKAQNVVLRYILQVCRALAELIKHRIYHMDLQPRNIIPKTNRQGQLEFKLIDFEISLFLDTTKPDVLRTLNNIWSLVRKYWKRKDYEIVHHLFDKMLCPEHQNVCLLFKNEINAPGPLQYEYLFVKQQDSKEFIDYLMIYMECYYRNALLEIIREIMSESKWLNENYQKLEKIITNQPFQSIDKAIQAIYSLWSSHF